MPGPRAGYSGVTVRIRDDYIGAVVERSASEVASPLVHRSCMSGSDCRGAGCRVQTGKTSGNLAEIRKMRERMAEAVRRREAEEFADILARAQARKAMRSVANAA